MPPETGQTQTSSLKRPILFSRATRLATPLRQSKTPEASTTEQLFCAVPVPQHGPPATVKNQQTPKPHEVLDYILGEMKTNSASEAVEKIRELNESHVYKDVAAEYAKHGVLWKILFGGNMLSDAMDADLAAKAAAKVEWACKVADARASSVGCGIWDHKPKIRTQWGVSQVIDFAVINKAEQVRFYYDIWSNIHYGYVGISAGFTEEGLLYWADAENEISNPGVPEPPSDSTAIKIGVALQDSGLSVPSLLAQLYQSRGRLHRYDPNRPAKDRVYITGE